MLSALHQGVGRVLRSSGKALDSVGQLLECKPVVDQLTPSLRSVALRQVQPKIAGSFVAPDAAVLGKVTIGARSSVWFGAVLRADVSTITIGNQTTVGDRVMIHVSSHPTELPTKIGNNVVIGAGAILHGCTIEDGAVIGEGAQIMDGAVVEKNAVVAPGSLVSPGKKVAAGTLWAGMPAVQQRPLTTAEIANWALLPVENAELAVAYAKETSKTWQQIQIDAEDRYQVETRSSEYYRRNDEEELSKRAGEFEYHMIPGRIFDTKISARTMPTSVDFDRK